MNKSPVTDAIVIDQISVAYSRELILDQLSCAIPQGGLVAIVGPNGAGKSTLLKSMLGFLKPLQGTISYMGTQRPPVMGYVPQRSSVDWDFPATVHDVVMMGTYHRLGWFRRPGTAEQEAAHDALKTVGMSHYADHHISELSGGQQQRVFLARALAQQTEITLMDEPLQGVDATTEEVILKTLHTLKDQQKTVIVVHHDILTVQDWFDDVILLNRKVIAHGKTADVLTQDNLSKTYGLPVTIPTA